MGFMDKAKKMAEQAQQKIDDVQKQFNESGSGATGQEGSAVEYDQHGRPKGGPAPAAGAPAPGAAAAGTPEPTGPGTPTSPDPAPAKAEGDPLLDDEPGSRQGSGGDAARKPPTPPSSGSGMTSGDPLAG